MSAVTSDMTLPTRLIVGGEAGSAADGSEFEDRSPIDGTLLAAVVSAKQADVDRAVSVGRRALEEGAWSKASPKERRAVLLRFATLVEKNSHGLARTASLETGKAFSGARGEVGAAVSALTFYAEAIDKVYGEVAPTGPGELGLITRDPIGVVAAITPWNYPLMMPAWKLGPALATGNSVILKPAEQSPIVAIRLVELGLEAGIPGGALSVLPGLGPEAGAALGRHPDIDAVTFTGSGEVGQLYLRYAGESNMKVVSLECGGKSPHLVFDDAPDLDEIAATVSASVFANAGQMCDAGSRLIVHEDIAEELTSKIVSGAGDWSPGDPLDPRAAVGAIIDEAQLEQALGFVDRAVSDGARLLAGGHRTREETGGTYMEPTVLAAVDPASELGCREVFGPVLAISTFRTVEDAVRIANGTSYGLAAGVWTRDLSKAAYVAEAIEAGSVFVNGYDRADVTVPFSGHRRSGIGVDRSLHALEKYTRLKTTWVHWTPPGSHA